MAKVSTPKKSEFLHQHILGEMLARNLPPGHKLPTERQLVKRFGVSQSTVAQAVKRLEQEGYIYRKVGSGTYVRDKTEAGEIAIIADRKFLSREAAMPFLLTTIANLLDAVEKRNPRWRGKLHTIELNGDGAQQDNLDILHLQTLPNLLGVISTLSWPSLAVELKHRGVPYVLLAQYNHYHSPNHVFFDFEDIDRKAFAHFTEIGCKRVGALWEIKEQANATRMAGGFASLAAQMGMQCRPEWMAYHLAERKSELGGYELFHHLWKQDSKPEALFVDDDLNFKGVVRAALELDVRFPEDIRVATIATRGTPIAYHKPVTVVETDTRLLAETAMDMLETLITRREPPQRRILLPSRLVRGQTT